MLIDKMHMMVTCKVCGETKPVSEFYTSKTRGKMYTATMCKECKKLTGRLAYNKANRKEQEKVCPDPTGETKDSKNKVKVKKKKSKDIRNREFFKISKKNIVSAGFLNYKMTKKKWVFDYIPIAKFKLDIECHHFVALAKDYPIELLKIFHRRYRRLKGRTMTLDKAGEIVAKYDIDFGLDNQ
jgi:hypothetical protein